LRECPTGEKLSHILTSVQQYLSILVKSAKLDLVIDDRAATRERCGYFH
jgi:hypothetical protein